MFNFKKFIYPGIRIKRWLMLFILSIIVFAFGFSGILGNLVQHIRIEQINVDDFFRKIQRLKFIDFLFLFLGIAGIILALRRSYFAILTMAFPKNDKKFIARIYKEARLKRGPKIAAIGGGTGLSTLLKGIKEYTSNLAAIVTVADDGGSSGRLRKEYNIIPPGDIRNCIVALADEEDILSKLFQYRFTEKGELKGHNFGNIFITALTKISGDFPKAIKEISKVLAIRGQVFPVSLDNIKLKAKLKNGKEIYGQSNITRSKIPIESVHIIPPNCKPYEQALKALKAADVILIGPGSLYTSIIPNLLIPQVREILENDKILKIYICNIMTQPGETDGYTVSDHIKAIFKHSSNKVIDYVLVNNGIPKEALLKKYRAENSYIVKIDREEVAKLGVKLICAKLIEEGEYIRHSPYLLTKAIMKIIVT
ncbi:MAG: YvcK family protein [Candidatus Goldbacteria bacterium]|nr:YvcK family protein [Candidatus Goldiibacteriota bacterium]